MPFSCCDANSTGVYAIDNPGLSEEAVFCDTSEGGGWWLAAVISQRGRSWEYNDEDGSRGQLSSAWESVRTFGSIDARDEDYKSDVFNVIPTSEMMIMFNGQHLLTAAPCWRFAPEGRSLLETFNLYKFRGSESNRWRGGERDVMSELACPVVSYSFVEGEEVLVARASVNFIYFKWGEVRRRRSWAMGITGVLLAAEERTCSLPNTHHPHPLLVSNAMK